MLEAGDTFHKGMNATSSGDALRAAQYNNMVKRLGIALEKWMADLSHDQRDVVARTQVVLVIGCFTSDLDT